ncbi:hypothetical protein [Metalysinibacillus jejuensis]|uniref:hypothetical protein n=1 Tax=Metalysinibacillus jejuensis TaxID=914327 RepID=UPI000D38E000|nr:hypothetical protein [Metalysinibacillus jejuensis]
MGKQLKKIAKYSMAAALATSALVPSAVALAADEKAVAKDITKVVVKNANDVLVELDIQNYGAALLFDTIVDTDIKYIVADNGDVYDLQDYGQALLFNDTKEGALESLKDKAVDVNTLDIKEGTISEDGKAVPNDETPEEKVNETFFYNLAA